MRPAKDSSKAGAGKRTEQVEDIDKNDKNVNPYALVAFSHKTNKIWYRESVHCIVTAIQSENWTARTAMIIPPVNA